MAINTCESCHASESSFEIRKRFLCRDCFIRYVHTKTRKRMESYRFQNLSGDQKKKLLLPLSGGVSSLSLLQVLDAQLNEQLAKQNRTAYELVLVHVDLLDSPDAVSAEWYSGIAEIFSMHRYLPVIKVYEAFTIDSSLENDLTHLGLLREPEQSEQSFYDHILQSTKSVTTRSDLRDLLLKRAIKATAKQHSCDGILWGHSDSRLAAQALSNVAKGRGGAVPGTLADGNSFATGVNSNCPMRDLFKSELELYASVVKPPLNPIPDESDTEPVTSIRNTSIDNLLNNYIMSQGVKYPSIMANVVRTASKLPAPTPPPNARCCAVCKNLLQGDNDQDLCYGCIRMKQDIKT